MKNYWKQKIAEHRYDIYKWGSVFFAIIFPVVMIKIVEYSVENDAPLFFILSVTLLIIILCYISKYGVLPIIAITISLIIFGVISKLNGYENNISILETKNNSSNENGFGMKADYPHEKIYYINNPSIEVADTMVKKRKNNKRIKFWFSETFFHKELGKNTFVVYTSSISDDKQYGATFLNVAGIPFLFFYFDEKISEGDYSGEIIFDEKKFFCKFKKIAGDDAGFIIFANGFSTEEFYEFMRNGNIMQINLDVGNVKMFTTFSLHGFTATTNRLLKIISK